MGMGGEPTKSFLDVPGIIPEQVNDVLAWLDHPFDIEQHPEPLAGFIDISKCTNLQVLARLFSLNGGPTVVKWGKLRFDRTAPYNFRGLSNASEAMLLNAMLNFGSGMLAAEGLLPSRLLALVVAQINLDGSQAVKH